jgi:glucose/arabinose dehydrogenase
VRARLVALVVTLALTLIPAPVSAADATVTTSGMAFVPDELTINRGDGLIHHNADAFDHNVTSVDTGIDGTPLFSGDTIGPGQTTRVEGVEELAPGSYEFYCSIHSSTMRGTLTVEGAPAGAPTIALAPLPGVFAAPVAMAQHPDSDDLYIVEKVGFIRAVRLGLVYDPVPVLDLSSEVSSGLEQGLLGLAFSPDGEFMYVNMTDTAGDTHILEFAFADGVAVPESRREVLTVDQPFANHNGGTMIFGPDGYLYIGLGDGGSGGDPEYNAQNLQTRLGKMLRIDPREADGAPFTVPTDNPFVPQDGEVAPVEALPEIWAYGLRNPWKFSFDRSTGDLWIADVGQNLWEEINLQRASSAGGENYGWNHMEGVELFTNRPPGAEEPADHTPPIHVYGRDNGACSVTGGYVYRGASASLQGAYVYSDWCEGRLRYLREQNGVVVEDGDLGLTVPSITAFGEDHAGELYAISLGGSVFRIVPVL